MLFYKDSDEDNITLSCDEDIQAMIETSTGMPKIFLAKELELSSHSSEEF